MLFLKKFFLRFYLFRRDGETPSKGEAGSPREAQCETRSQDPGVTTWAKGGCSTPEPPRDPTTILFTHSLPLPVRAPQVGRYRSPPSGCPVQVRWGRWAEAEPPAGGGPTLCSCVAADHAKLAHILSRLGGIASSPCPAAPAGVARLWHAQCALRPPGWRVLPTQLWLWFGVASPQDALFPLKYLQG